MVGSKTNVTSEHEMAAPKEGGKISTNDMATLTTVNAFKKQKIGPKF